MFREKLLPAGKEVTKTNFIRNKTDSVLNC